MLSGIGQKGENTATAEKGGMSFMQLFLNKKEVPALIRAIELLIAQEPQCSDAENFFQESKSALKNNATLTPNDNLV